MDASNKETFFFVITLKELESSFKHILWFAIIRKVTNIEAGKKLARPLIVLIRSPLQAALNLYILP